MIKLEFKVDRITKNAKRFAEITDKERGIVGNIYVLKSELDTMGDPEVIEVTIKPVKK